MKIKRLLSIFLAISLIAAFGFASAQEIAPVVKTSQYNILLDGKPLQLQSGSILMVDGRTMAPAESFLTAIGATSVSIDAGAGEATLGNHWISFSEGSNELSVKSGDADASKVVELSKAPIAIDSELYVPVRAIAENLGLSVSWDASQRTVVLINIDKLIFGIDSKYTVFNSMLQLTNDPEKTYEATANYTQNMKTKVDGKETPSNAKGVVDLLMKGVDLNMDYSMEFDVEGMLSAMTEEERKAIPKEQLDLMKNIKMKFIYNSAEETFYINMGKMLDSLFTGLVSTDPEAKGGIWYKLDLTDLIDMTGIYAEDLHKLASGDVSWLTVEKILKMCLDHSDMYNVSSYDGLRYALIVSEELISDKAFIIAGSEDKPVYKYSLDEKKLNDAFKAAQKEYPLVAQSLGSLIDLTRGLKFNMTCEMRVEGEYIFATDMQFTCSIEMPEEIGGKVDVSMDLKSNMPGKTTMTQTMDTVVAGSEVSSNMDLEMNVAETTKKVESAPPQGDKIVDIMTIIEMMVSSLIAR